MPISRIYHSPFFHSNLWLDMVLERFTVWTNCSRVGHAVGEVSSAFEAKRLIRSVLNFVIGIYFDVMLNFLV